MKNRLTGILESSVLVSSPPALSSPVTAKPIILRDLGRKGRSKGRMLEERKFCTYFSASLLIRKHIDIVDGRAENTRNLAGGGAHEELGNGCT